MKKILIVSQNFYPEIGSAGNRMKNIYLLLKEYGFDITILTTDPTYPNRNLYKDSFFWDDPKLNKDKDIYRIKIKNKRYSRSIVNRLFYYLEIAIKMVFYILKSRGEYDVVLASSPPIFIAMVGLFAKYRYRAKLVLDIRDLWPESLNGVGVFNYPIIINLFKKIETIMYKKASYIIVNSKGFIDYILSRSKNFKYKIKYIPNGARKNEIINFNTIPKTFKVIYAGNIGLAQDDLIIKKLADELNNKNIDLTIIGYGLRRDSTKEFIQKRNLKNVTFVNPMTRRECFKIISQHQVGIVTLINEDVFKTVLPGKIIDYMTCGVPIIGSVAGFSKEVILEEKVGFVSDNHDIKDLLTYIDELRKNIELQQKMSMNGNKYVQKNFLWESNIESLVKILNQEYL